MINFTTPLLIEENGEWMVQSKYCKLKVDIFHEGGDAIWIRLDPADTIYTAEYEGQDMFGVLRTCMSYQRLFNRAANNFGVSVVKEIQRRFNPNGKRAPVMDYFLRAVSMAWEEVLNNDDWENRRTTLELDLREIKPLDPDWRFDIHTLLDTKGIGQFTPKVVGVDMELGTVTIARVVSILLTGLAFWYDNLLEMALDWNIQDALEGDNPLYTVQLNDQTGTPTILVYTNKAVLRADTDDDEDFSVESSHSFNTGMSVRDEKYVLARMTPLLINRLCAGINRLYSNVFDMGREEF